MSRAGQAQTIIRDTEIEDTLRSWATPVFTSAGLVPDNVHIILVQSPDVNAFVAGGPNIFLFTGLIDKAENPGEIIGVIAHETGHISGGHLVRLRGAMEQASYEAMIGTLLGIGAAVFSGQGEVAGAIISSTQNVAARRFLANSRLNESSADQAGLKYLNDAHMNPTGLLTFLQKLESDELLPDNQQSEYVRTHPLTGNRLDALRTKIKDSPYQGQNTSPEWAEEFSRMKAKLKAFIAPEQIEWAYPATDTSVAARYARAIAAYRLNHVEEAIQKIDALLTQEPDNPFFCELKGQMLLEFGRVAEAIPAYQKAVTLQPQSALIRTSYAQALIEQANRTETTDLYQQAIQELEKARQKEKKSPLIYRLLATAHGRLGDEVSARLNLAEEAVLQGRVDDARHLAEFVRDHAPAQSQNALRASDILKFLEKNAPTDN
ncbi:MAG: M48 family metallopeptidase [Rhodospirillales bacterium]|nr:M48 family metallopeptidase [Rhodospirillales bacterium]MCB9965428.1 M48 family metallopeptidase [Rhodospirillales bacterium]MCB9973929.1 M48 family metallopeptidase [Rhodospirillales bacterium]MCB9979867.1 M48 family metallopeptidase [Rhodospirillales bacterium]